MTTGLTDQRVDTFETLRSTEFRRLDEQGHVYLDYTGSGLYSESQIRAHAEFLAGTVLGNPHSENPTSVQSTEIVEAARLAVLRFFQADPDEYAVCFTPNASGALKLVGEAYPFRPGSRFVLTTDNHNSVNGIREYATARGATVMHLSLSDDLRLPTDVERMIPNVDGEAPSLFAYPAQSNFSGVQHPLALVEHAQRKGYDVVLDAAAFVATNRLSLREVSPDYVCVSFYKMFGFPTGVGALIARHEALERLERPWFAGGTVEFVSVQNRMHQLYTGPMGFEDGTPNFIDIAAVRTGLDFLSGVGVERIHDHVSRLTEQLLDRLERLEHSNGAPLVRLYGPDTTEQRGGIVAFNVMDPAGRVVFYEAVEREASRVGISIRGGCFCNPGASEAAFHIDADEARRCLESFKPGEFTPERFSDCMGGDPVGGVRASLGVASNETDLNRLVEFLTSFRDSPTRAG